MEATSTSSKKIIINTGLLLGLASIGLSVILYILNMHLEQNMVSGLIGLLIILIFVVYGIKQYKKANENLLSISQALKVGVGVALIGGIVSVLYTLIFINVIEPDFMNQMAEVQREAILKSNPDMTDEQLQTALSFAKKFSSPAIISAMSLIFSVFFGFIFSLITGLIMKNDRN
ncbi:DUF4199 domain-containing protein [Aegicerativicinus sediminis]|uniref:DUF4199 domain-containing protein n=1 Tax=Aegicerativicinus sediminis TaxID=2893202 RepID=UPI001E46F7B4|nr:DUF4199 domain-containing protein [Aegicerativicinus sediminis]